MVEPQASVTCSVCISPLGSGTELCIPCTNNHKFHRQCLFDWAKTMWVCPMCREKFDKVTLMENDVVIGQITPPPIDKDSEEMLNMPLPAPYNDMACEVCGLETQDERMLICDSCNLGFHMHCLEPPLNRIPRGLWDCPSCRPSTSAVVAMPSTISEGEATTSSADREPSEDHKKEDDDAAAKMIYNEDSAVLLATSAEADPAIRSMRRKKDSQRRKHKSKKKSREKEGHGKEGKKHRKKSRRKKRRRESKRGKRKSKESMEEASKHSRERIADACGVDLGKSTRYRMAVSSASRGEMGLRTKLDINGREWIPPPDKGDVLESQDREPAETTLTQAANPIGASSPYCGSTSLIDEILSNQSKILVPGKFLKINRDGTLTQQTSELEKYLQDRQNDKEERERKANKGEARIGGAKSAVAKNDTEPTGRDTSTNVGQDRPIQISKLSSPERRQIESIKCQSMRTESDPSPEMRSAKKSRWEPSLPKRGPDAETKELLVRSQITMLEPSQPIPLARVLPHLITSTTAPDNAALDSTNLVNTSLLNSAPPPLPLGLQSLLPMAPPAQLLGTPNFGLLANELALKSAMEALSTQRALLLPPLGQPPLGSLHSTTGAQSALNCGSELERQLLAASNSILSTLRLPHPTPPIANLAELLHQLSSRMGTSDAAHAGPDLHNQLPLNPFLGTSLLPDTVGIAPGLLPSSFSAPGACLTFFGGVQPPSVDMEIDADEEGIDTPEPVGGVKAAITCSTKVHSKKGGNRSEAIKLADAAMKSALLPYYEKWSLPRNRIISKEEYKALMKKGVSKMLDSGSKLKPSKVESFVRKYVDTITARRKRGNRV